MNAGDTFLVPGMDDHLWMVLSDPSVNPHKVVVVCFLSWQPYLDQACVVQPGAHPFVKHATCVNYQGARVERDELLERLKQEGKLTPKHPLGQNLLDLIRPSAEKGDIPTEAYEVLREQGFVGR